MSLGSLSQLKDSYARIIESTLRRVREAGLLRDVPAGSEVVDELGCRWRGAVERELAAMAACRTEHSRGHPQAQITLPVLLPPEGLIGPKAVSRALKDAKPFNPMDGVSFAEEFVLPPPPARGALPAAHQFSGGFASSHVEAPARPMIPGLSGGMGRSGLAGSTGRAAAEPPRKRARTTDVLVEERTLAPPLSDALTSMNSLHAEQRTLPPGSSGPPPVGVLEPVVPLSDAAAAEVGSDDEYAGCFDDADVIVSNTCQPQGAKSLDGAVSPAVQQSRDACGGSATAAQAPSEPIGDILAEQSSDGSELGSDLDDSEFDFPVIKNSLFAQVKRVARSRKRWSVQLGRGVLTIDGVECLISGARGVFDIDDNQEIADENLASASGALEDA